MKTNTTYISAKNLVKAMFAILFIAVSIQVQAKNDENFILADAESTTEYADLEAWMLEPANWAGKGEEAAADHEEEAILEEWMTTTSAEWIETEAEIELEEWMVNSEDAFWNLQQNNIQEDAEEEMELEAWMFDASSWNK